MWLDGLPVGQISAGALVALIVLLILTGRLVPRQQLLDARADRDLWRTSAENWQDSALKLGMSMEKVVALAEVTNHLITDLQEQANRESR